MIRSMDNVLTDRSWQSILRKRRGHASQSADASENEGDLEHEYYKVLDLIRANKTDRPLVICHVAQTLDGKIACANGQSKWIGNEENLRHAHRMRALCDAVMIGKNTLEQDQPLLTVRHVDGDDPVKLHLIGNSMSGNTYLRECKVVKGEETTVIEWDSLDDLLKSLKAFGIESIYLEGGGKSISYFLHHQSVDLLQIHIAPILLGSGFPSFSFPEVLSINDALVMEDRSVYNVHGEIMISGKLAYREQ